MDNHTDNNNSQTTRSLAEVLNTVNMQSSDSASYSSYSGTAEFTDDWAQGRAIYGGIAAAVLLKAMRHHVAADRPLRSLLVSFVGPVAPGTIDIQVNVLREGRSASQLEAKILQNGEVMTSVQAAFGGDRESVAVLASPPQPDVKPPEQGVAFPYIPGITPEFTTHLDYRITEGMLPFMGSETAKHGGWFKFKDLHGLTAGTVDNELLIVALADAFPPAALQMLKKPAAASSLTWALDFTTHAATSDPEGWWYLQASAEAGGNGYTQQSSHLWNPAGELVAFDYQTVAIFG